MEKPQETTIVATDSIAEVWSDSVGSHPRERKRNPIQGTVEVYETDENGKKQLIRKSNLVIYKGREWAAVRLTNVDNLLIAPTPPDPDAFICWFGVGSGGVAGADPFDPLSPTNQDDDLTIDEMLHATDASLGDYRIATPGYYKTLFDSVGFEEDIYNDNRYLVIKFVATVGTSYANGSEINEAGLFAAASDFPGLLSTGPFFMFARVTFPTILKNALRTLTFVWYIYV
jgi:hypothetical protein